MTGLPGSGCTATSNEAKLTIHPLPKGGILDVRQTIVCATTPLVLTLDGAVGTMFEWQAKSPVGDWITVATTSVPQVTVTPDNVQGIWYYRAKVSTHAGCGEALSDEKPVEVLGAGSGGHIQLLYGDKPYLCRGESRTMQAIGYDGSLQWQRSENNGAFVNVPGATSDVYMASNLAADNTYQYRVRANSASCPGVYVYSDTLELKVYDQIDGGTLVNLATGGDNIEMCYGSDVSLKLQQYWGEPVEWIYSETGAEPYKKLYHAGATYSLSQLSQGTYYIRTVVTSGCANDTSSTIKVVVKEPLIVNLTVDNDTRYELPGFCKGHELVLKVTTGAGKDNVAASDTWTGTIVLPDGSTTTGTYTGPYWRVNTMVPASGTYIYRATYGNSICAAQPSNAITVGYNANVPGAGTLTSPVEFCDGETTPGTVTLSGNSATIEQWEYKNLALVPGSAPWTKLSVTAGSITVNPTQLAPDVTYLYRVRVSDATPGFGACSVTYSNEARVIKYSKPAVNPVTVSKNTYCNVLNVNLRFTGSKGATFMWDEFIDGAFNRSGVDTVSSHVPYTGNGFTAQTVTYKVTPVVGEKQCAGDSRTGPY
jgi:hypothetical protein